MKIEFTENGEGEYPSIEAFRDMHRTATIEAIDDKYVVGQCEVCEKVIFDGEEHVDWLDGVTTCKECSPCQEELETMKTEG